MKINNVSEYGRGKKFIVFREHDGENWYYSGWDDLDDALRVCAEIGGQVAPVELVEG